MCRFVAYHGPPIQLDELLYKPEHSVIKQSVVATRYASPEDATAQSLSVGEAGSFVSDGEFVATPDPEGDAATLVASEPLFEDGRVWRAVPRNHLVTVAPDGETAVEPLDLNLDAP